MVFAELVERLHQRILESLPGPPAHEHLRAEAVGSLKPRFDHKLPPKPGSVLILLYEQDGVIRFPLIKRQEYLGAHSGQISLPGGKAEHNEDPVETALREGEEEIGIVRQEITVLGKLTDFFVMPSNFMVTPIVAAVDGIPIFKPDPYEVARIIYGNIADLVKDDAVLVKEIIAAGQYTMKAPHFEIEGEVVWGATAMILNELRIVLQEIISTNYE